MTTEPEDSGEYQEPIPPETPPPLREQGVWSPRLNPTQQKVFDSGAKYALSYGEKGSGKTVSSLSALIRHAYEEDDALVLIIAPQIRTGKEGVIYDLMWMLDIWRNGNIDPTDPERRRRLDEGMGLEYTEPTLDPQTKDRVIFIGNRFGGWSKVILMSIPYAEVVEKRMKALSPSFVYVDEITELDSREFFTYVAQQLGRRRGIRGPQQYYATCNPEGPSHWVYKVWWEDCIDENTGVRHTDYAVFHIPVAENIANLPPGYTDRLKALYRDPIDYARLVDGRWVDRPLGDAIFKNYFRSEFHVRGDAKTNAGLMPLKGFPIIVSYDPGPVNYSVHFEQMLPGKEKTIWTVFDELNFVGQFMPDTVVVKHILDRMEYWKRMVPGAEFVHVADESAFTHRRHDGSYDATRLVQLSNGVIRPRACPKAKESVPQRVNMVITMFLNDSLFISATCTKTLEMLRLLASEKPKEGREVKYNPNAALTPKRSAYLHPFDSLSYGIFYFAMNPLMVALHTQETTRPQIYTAGGGGRLV